MKRKSGLGYLVIGTVLITSCADVLGLGDYKNHCGGDLDATCPPGQGGGGGAPPCTVVTDCPDPGTTCARRQCVNGACEPSSTPKGATCHDEGGSVCDGAGTCVECLANADCGDSSTTCATLKCSGSHTCVMSNAGFGVACADHGGAVCDGKGACVECNTAADCDSGTACKIMPSCSSKACKYSNASAGTSCTDGNGHLCNDSGECFGLAAITAGGNHTCVVTTLGAAKCWGSNSKGQLGDNSMMDQVAPTDVLGLESGVRGMSNSDQTSCALLTGGGVKCWGWNADGEVGDGTTTDRPTPVDVPGLSNVKSLASSAIGAHMCAVTAGGGLKCWGNNIFGQLGDGTTTNQSAPADVPALASGVTSVATGFVHTCAIKTSGELLCWGLNNKGQLGDGTTTNQSAPVDVAWSHSASRVAGGQQFTCALTTAGGPFCWGDNSAGELGTGDMFEEHNPIPISGLGSARAIVTGLGHACALTQGGGVKCWGADGTGQLGDDKPANSQSAPVDVVGLSSGVVSIVAGDGYTCALMAAGGVKCWGQNNSGQLGDGTKIERDVPVDVLGL